MIGLAGCATPKPRGPQPAAAAPPPIIVLSGDSAELGTEHGQQLAERIRFLHDNYLKVFITADDRALSAAAAFESFVTPEHRDEIAALAQATGIEPQQMMLAQCFLDLSAINACSTMTLPGEAAPDGVPRFARNLDFPGLNVADQNTVVLIFRPRDRYAFAAVSWPGLVGVLSGMNEHGLTLANMELTRKPRQPGAMPYSLLYRTLLERCRTVAEAIALLEQTPRQTANNLMLMDASGDRALVEITPARIAVRRADLEHALISTNHQRGQEGSAPGFCRRYDAMLDLSQEQFGDLGVKQLQAMLGRVAQGDMTLQSMVFEPSNRVIYLATGANAPTHPFHRIDLKPYLNPAQTAR